MEQRGAKTPSSLSFLLLAALCCLYHLAEAWGAPSSPPVWPEQLHAVLLQNRSGALANVDLYYDWPGG